MTYIRVTGNSKEIPILNSNSSVGLLTQVNEGKSISFIYTICLYRGFGIHSIISLLFTQTINTFTNSVLDKLLGQLGIYATWLSSIAYLQKLLRIFYIFTPRFWQWLHTFSYWTKPSRICLHIYSHRLAFLSIKLADFIVHEANLIALLTLAARIHFAKFFR